MHCRLWTCTSNRARRMCLHARKQASKQTESNLAWYTVLDAMCVCALSKVQDCVLSLSLPAGVIKDNPKASSIWHNAGIFCR